MIVIVFFDKIGLVLVTVGELVFIVAVGLGDDMTETLGGIFFFIIDVVEVTLPVKGDPRCMEGPLLLETTPVLGPL